eukprot:gene10198-18875_t
MEEENAKGVKPADLLSLDMVGRTPKKSRVNAKRQLTNAIRKVSDALTVGEDVCGIGNAVVCMENAFNDFSKTCTSGSKIGLSVECNEIGSLLRYDKSSFALKHPRTGFCFHGVNGKSSTNEDEELTYSTKCNQDINRYYFQKNVRFVIRHYTTSFCLVHDKADNFLKLQNTFVCDRFEFVNTKNLRHVATGKCVERKVGSIYLILSKNCSSDQTKYELKQNLLIANPASGKCVHADGGRIVPGFKVSLYECWTDDLYKWNFYDDRDIVKVKVISEDCTDLSGYCPRTRGQIFVNGYQYSQQFRGINVAVFDYRSSILERSEGYDIWGDPLKIDALATMLNSLAPDKLFIFCAKDAIKMTTSLANELQKVGVPASVTEIVKDDITSEKISLAAIFYTGDTRMEWEYSTSSRGGGASIIETTLYPFRDYKGFTGCSEEIGLRIGYIPDKGISAQSVFDNNLSKFGTQHARLHSAESWCAGRSSSVSVYLQVDIGMLKFISGVAIQTSQLSRESLHPVKRFYIIYSKDGVKWTEFSEDGTNRKVFLGNINLKSHVKVNWFLRTRMRFIRIVPLERQTDESTHCIRMELFGCDSGEVVFEETFSASSGKEIGQRVSGKFSFQAGAPLTRQVYVHVSTSENRTSLAKNIEQYHFQDMNQTVRASKNNSLSANAVNITYVTANRLGMKSAARIHFNLPNLTDHYIYDIWIRCWVVDSKLNSSTVWNTYSYETSDRVLAVALPFAIKRRTQDYSLIALNISTAPQNAIASGDRIVLNISLTPWMNAAEIGHSNAYELDLLVYFEETFLNLRSIEFLRLDDGSLLPSRNTTSFGFIRIETDTFGPISKQNFQLTFDASIPSSINKDSKCNTNIIWEFKYRTNLLKYNGELKKVLENLLPFNCQIPNKARAVTSTNRLSLPTLSIVYDDVNNDVIICKKDLSLATYYQASCFWQGSNNLTWQAIPMMYSVVGVDTSKRHLYGIDNAGEAYVRSSYDFKSVKFVQDDEWTAIQGHDSIRKAKSTDNLAALPISPTDNWILPSRDNQVLAVTAGGVKRMFRSGWKKTVTF